MNSLSLKSAFENNWDHTSNIQRGIEQNRKSEAMIQIMDDHGRPLSGAALSVAQDDSPFHFGANIFMLDGYSSPELNRRYEDAYCRLFNAATVPFYWAGMEPVQGNVRYGVDSPFVARRPPPDRAISFCEERGLKIHGHTLVWDHATWSLPSWLPENPEKSLPLWEARVREIARRYGHRIHRWDVVNEAVPDRGFPISGPMPSDYERLAFSWAQRYFPEETQFHINEMTDAWTDLLQRYMALIRRLLDDGARVGGIGMQFHLFGDEGRLEAFLKGKLHPPEQQLAALDALSVFQLPIHISEITLVSPRNDELGREQQAEAACQLYRLWFSHPGVQGISWWNVPDGGAAAGEDKVFSGLLDEQLEPKPAYNALYNLIHREWRTNLKGVTDNLGGFRFRGFHGNYHVTVNEGFTARFSLNPSQSLQKFVVQVKEASAVV